MEREAREALLLMAKKELAEEEQAQTNNDKSEGDEEHQLRLQQQLKEKELSARIVPKVSTSLSGYAVFGYSEHVVQEALCAQIIAKYAPSLGIDSLTAAGMQKYGINSGIYAQTQQRRSSKRERKEISKFVDVSYTATTSPQKRKTSASIKLKKQAKSSGRNSKSGKDVGEKGTIAKLAGKGGADMRKNASDRSITDQFLGLNDSISIQEQQPPMNPIGAYNNNNNNVSAVHQSDATNAGMQSWENVLFEEQFYTTNVNQQQVPMYQNPGTFHGTSVVDLLGLDDELMDNQGGGYYDCTNMSMF